MAYQVVPINLPEPLNCNQINTSSTRLNIGWVVSFLSHSAFCASRLPINMVDVSTGIFVNRQLLTCPDSDRCLEGFSHPFGLARRCRHLAPNTCGHPAEDRYREATFPRGGDVGKRYACHDAINRPRLRSDLRLFVCFTGIVYFWFVIDSYTSTAGVLTSCAAHYSP